MKRSLSIFIASAAILAANTICARDIFTIKGVQSRSVLDSSFIVVYGEGAPVFKTSIMNNPPRLVVTIENGRLPRLPVELSYAYPIKRIELQPDYENHSLTRLVAEFEKIDGYVSSVVQEGIMIAIAASDISAGDNAVIADNSPEWLNRIVDINFENTPLDLALSLMAQQNGFDVAMSGLDEHEVTARLAGVSVKDALEAILSVSGLAYYTVGGIVVVKSPDEEAPGEMITRIFKLNFLDSRQIEQQIKNMLSSRGKVQVVAAGQAPGDGSSARFPASVLAVTDINPVILLVEEFVSGIDVKPRQVAISVKLIETNINDDQAFGFDWETGLAAKITGAEGDNQAGDQTATGLSAYSTLPIRSGSFTYGNLTFSEVATLLEYLHTAGESRLLSSPSVTTTDGKPAMIDVVSTIPIQTINRFSEGAVIQDIVTFQYKEVGITLNVTPIINKDGFITLKCEPTVEEITGWVGPANNQQPITAKRSVQTDVMVKSGETLVIGGLMKESVIEKVQGIWLLSDIPVLGELFKHRSKQNTKTDLMILITPSIIP